MEEVVPDRTSPFIPSHCASIAVASTLRVKFLPVVLKLVWLFCYGQLIYGYGRSFAIVQTLTHYKAIYQ